MMMDGLDHPKTLDLAARLDTSIPQVIGHLELLWAFAAQKTPRGNIGKWPDGTIARAAQWTADPTIFVTALHEAGFVDASAQHRYLIHDWPDHCPRWVKAKLKKLNLSFCLPDCSGDYRADSMPSHATPSEAKPSQATNEPSAHADESNSKRKAPNAYPDDFERLWAEYPKRHGGNPKATACKAWKARRREGTTADDLLAATRRYAEHCHAQGKAGTEFVMQAATFFGKDRRFEEEYPIGPSAKPAFTRNESAARQAVAEMQREQEFGRDQ